MFENVILKDQCLEIFDFGPLLRYLHRLGTNPILILMCLRSSREWLEPLTVNAEVAAVLGSIPASSDTVEYEGRQMKQCF